MSKDIRDTIRKLLNLGHDKGASESEAKAALLKAKELMMKYNIDQIEIMKHSDTSVSYDVERYITDITFSTRVDPWIVDLADLIAKNSRCKYFFLHTSGKKRKTIGFYGYDFDLQVCTAMFNYAVYCIWDHFSEIWKYYDENYGMGVGDCRPFTNGYGYGFVEGMKTAFEEQYNNHKEWALVALTPTAVLEYAESKVTSVDLNTPIIDENSYKDGIEDGKKWKPEQQLYNTGIESEV